jgi:hypothetical protein
VRYHLRLEAAPHVIPERHAVAPRRDVGPEPLVGETLGGVGEYVRGRL